MTELLQLVKRFKDFKGRTRRREYWNFFLFYIIGAILATGLDLKLGTTATSQFGGIYLAYSIIMLLPSINIGVRRLHDIGKSGWMMLIAILPLIGTIWLLIIGMIEGEPGNNKWGNNPKEQLQLTQPLEDLVHH